MATSRSLHCLFYSHVWSIFQLETLGILKPGNGLLLELALDSKFAPVFGMTEKQKGLPSLLQPGIQLDQLTYKPDNVSAPIILAPNPPALSETLIAALALVESTDSPVADVTVLIHLNDAPHFSDAYPYMKDFAIVWDIADYPNSALTELTEVLVNGEHLSQASWKGFYLCNRQTGQLPEHKARELSLRTLLNDFPTLAPA